MGDQYMLYSFKLNVKASELLYLHASRLFICQIQQPGRLLERALQHVKRCIAECCEAHLRVQLTPVAASIALPEIGELGSTVCFLERLYQLVCFLAWLILRVKCPNYVYLLRC